MVRPDYFRSINVIFWRLFCARWLHKAGSTSSPTNLTFVGQTAGAEVAPPSMISGHILSKFAVLQAE